MNAPEPITLICIGPLPNIAAALEREPRIAEKARFVGMHGSVKRGYGNSGKIAAEWNVRANPEACRKVFTAPHTYQLKDYHQTVVVVDSCVVYLFVC